MTGTNASPQWFEGPNQFRHHRAPPVPHPPACPGHPAQRDPIRPGPFLFLIAMVLFSGWARADSVDCAHFYADPATYSGPPGVITVDGNSATFAYSFVVSTTYVNDCTDTRIIGGGFGTDWDPMLADDP